MMVWYRDPTILRFVVCRYIPWLAALNLAWEAAHVRLYTLWVEATPGYIAFSVLHCTIGDVLIGIPALLLALVVARERAIAQLRLARIALLSTLFGAGYTVWSEWMNVALLGSCTYAESMPRIPLGNFELGLTPLLQWLVIPPLVRYVTFLRRHAAPPAER